MPEADLSNLRALIADDRAEVRQILGAALRGLGVIHIDTVEAGIAGTNLVAVMTKNEMAGAAHADTPEQVADLVTRFSHDVASPLMCVLALSGLLVREAQAANRSGDDLKRIQAAAEEIAVMVRALGERAATGDRARWADES